MLAMNSSSVSIGCGSPAQALRMTVCSMPWIASGYCQPKAWSMRRGLPSRIDQQVLRRTRVAQRRRIERAVGAARLAGAIRRRHRLRIRRLEAERARGLDRAQQQLQHVQRAAGLEAVAVRADAAHGVHRHRPADGLGVHAAPGIGPRDRQPDLLVEGGARQFAREAADGLRIDAAAVGDGVRRVVRGQIARREALERRHRALAVGERDRADHARRDAAPRRRARSPPSRVAQSGWPSASRATSPSVAVPGASSTSQCALV